MFQQKRLFQEIMRNCHGILKTMLGFTVSHEKGVYSYGKHYQKEDTFSLSMDKPTLIQFGCVEIIFCPPKRPLFENQENQRSARITV